MPVAPVGFEMRAFGPFVPGINEDHAMIGRLGLHPRDRFAKPAPIGLRRGIMKDECTVAGARRVVPCGEDGFVATVGCRVRFREDLRGLLVVVNAKVWFSLDRNAIEQAQPIPARLE